MFEKPRNKPSNPDQPKFHTISKSRTLQPKIKEHCKIKTISIFQGFKTTQIQTKSIFQPFKQPKIKPIQTIKLKTQKQTKMKNQIRTLKNQNNNHLSRVQRSAVGEVASWKSTAKSVMLTGNHCRRCQLPQFVVVVPSSIRLRQRQWWVWWVSLQSSNSENEFKAEVYIRGNLAEHNNWCYFHKT